MTIQRPSLDRAAELREEPDVLDRLRDDPMTRVIVVREGRVRVIDSALLRVPPAAVVLLLAAAPPETEALDAAPDEIWLGLRDLGGRIDGQESELLIGAIALAGWLRDAPFCPTCGGGTELQQAGWSRRCLVCGRQHFPRTDPAVIVAVESRDGERLLLGANANWGGRMFSCFAGFTEAGESLESTAYREIEEESGVRLSALRYISSQAWPFPRSLMVGFRAIVDDESAARPDGEEIIEVRWFTRAEIGSALAGDGPVGLPGPASIARALIIDWYEDRA
jgi:NAD+ diphosphatase